MRNKEEGDDRHQQALAEARLAAEVKASNVLPAGGARTKRFNYYFLNIKSVRMYIQWWANL